ncbi:MAG: hypothetical protein GX088_03990 [Clostridia bacterium]|nr:hypothetical protein [Clostridia bacterium]
MGAGSNEEKAEFSKNIILYGPPGTGKTYHTVNYAVAIIEEKPLEEIFAEDYTAVKNRFNQYKKDGLIEFITFHQSYGYEEFIVGIKPVCSTDDEETNEISYEIVDGVFKKICDRASMPVISKSNDLGFSENSSVWKVSLAGSGDNPVRRDCMENNYIRIGFDEYGETITEETDFSEYGGKNALNAFILC